MKLKTHKKILKGLEYYRKPGVDLLTFPPIIIGERYKKQEGAELCQAQPAKHKLFGFNRAIFFGLDC